LRISIVSAKSVGWGWYAASQYGVTGPDALTVG
jgi:hypothetical protein